jgi:hypothetical protein
MGNGGNVEPHVPEVHLNDDDSVALVIQLVGFDSGSWADISGYITQGDGVFAPFSAIQAVPDPVNGVSSVTVNVPKMGLVPGKDVNVITRVTEVELWPTALAASQAAPGVQASWAATSGTYAPPTRTGPMSTSAASAAGSNSSPGDSFTIGDLQNGIKFVITIQAQPAG